jgi:hypothetical protein
MTIIVRDLKFYSFSKVNNDKASYVSHAIMFTSDEWQITESFLEFFKEKIDTITAAFNEFWDGFVALSAPTPRSEKLLRKA